ncbi:MAG: D-alanyl-D-alanine carboxypeptidase [Lentisphaerae bacterium]|nr:MAG: D-alanyl-D-alanine carboxypeptidase [Lentisphaerota bacterium]
MRKLHQLAFVLMTLIVTGCSVAVYLNEKHSASPGDAGEAVLPVEEKPAPRTLSVLYPNALDDYRVLELPLNGEAARWEKACTAGILVVPAYRLILWRKRDEQAFPIASITKLMTLILAFEFIQEGRAELTTPVQVSNRASQTGGSRVWLQAHATYPLGELMKACLIKSANDAAQAVAEALAPNHDSQRFVTLMNIKARQIGMRKARFYNVHGLPGPPDNVASPRDLVLLAMTACQYPQLLEWARTVTYDFRHPNGKVVKLRSTNWQLLSHCPGVLGLKTGYTDRAGSCVTTLCRRNGVAMIAVALGFHTHKGGILGRNKRYYFVRALLDWGYATLEHLNLEPSLHANGE